MSKNSNKQARETKRDKFDKPAGKRRLPVALFIIGGIVLVMIAAIPLWAWANASRGAAPPPEQMTDITADVQDGIARLPLSAFDDGAAHFYAYQTESTPIQFFVLKSSDGVVRAAFNACDVCYRERKGYQQEGDEMICNNCGQRFSSVLINEVKGGCNPAPLNRTVEGDELIIRVDDILAGVGYFR